MNTTIQKDAEVKYLRDRIYELEGELFEAQLRVKIEQDNRAKVEKKLERLIIKAQA
tara:strand:- start:897 stop:1064 length:168 start_codon:yes stop_codon:yes gene_type:complete